MPEGFWKTEERKKMFHVIYHLNTPNTQRWVFFPSHFPPKLTLEVTQEAGDGKLRNTSCGSFSPSPSFLPDISTLNKDNSPFLNINYLTAHSEKIHCPSLSTEVRDETELHGDQSSGVSSPIDGEIDPSHLRRGVFSCVFCEYIEAVQSAIWLF